jgi:hypothetical protein
MASRLWFDELQERLAAHELPRAYVRRFVRELADHFEDLKEEQMGTEADALLRLGEPRQVADAAVDTYRRRSLVGRYSAVTFLVFAVSPILSLVVFAAVGLLVMFAAARGLGFVDDSGTHLGTSAKAVLPYLVTALTILIPSAVLTALYFGLAKRSGIGRRWTIVSCVVLSVLAGLAMCDVQLSDLPGQSRLTFGLGVGFSLAHVGHLCQALFPLAVGLWLLRRSRVRRLDGVPGEAAVLT